MADYTQLDMDEVVVLPDYTLLDIEEVVVLVKYRYLVMEKVVVGSSCLTWRRWRSWLTYPS